MKSRLAALGLIAALAMLAFALGYLGWPGAAPAPAPGAPTATPVVRQPLPATPALVSATPAATPAAGGDLLDELNRLCDRLERERLSPQQLAAIRAALLAAEPRAAIAAIRKFLRSGRNAPTGQEFAVGAGGVLKGTPTLRLLLLDVLGQIARTSRSSAAAEVAREILAERGSADEWAVALRNVGWAEPQSRGFLADRFREMLRHEPWRQAPSAGLLEAFDVVVFTRDASLIPELDDARAANRELAHAADIALDRLADASPLDVLTFLNAHPTRLSDRPFLRADYFAKADLGQGPQRAQIEIYLGRPDVGAEEKAKLLRAMTAPASFVSDSLLSTPPPADDGSTRRAALAETVRDWLKRDRFPLLREPLREIEARLTP